MTPDARWQRLAEVLRARRVVELGIPNRTEFARTRGLKNPRLLVDLETGRRDNYDPDTLLSLIRWYDLPADRLADILGDRWPLNESDIVIAENTELFSVTVNGAKVTSADTRASEKAVVYQVAVAIAQLAALVEPLIQRSRM